MSRSEKIKELKDKNAERLKSAKERASKVTEKGKIVTESKFVKEFKDFISRGNVIDLAVGVVVGGAFGTIVNSVVNDIMMPVISLVVGGLDFTNLTWVIPNFFGGDTQATIYYGRFIQNVVNFLVIAFCVFLVVRVINRLQKKKKEEEAAAAAAAKAAEKDEKAELLKEILKELKKK
jgi:large conductance mechanosensitive channel